MDISQEDLYEIIYEATKQALADHKEEGTYSLASRMLAGSVVFRDGEGRTVKESDAISFFKKTTSVREKLRVLEQKVNNHKALSAKEKAELQVYITRAYGSLTTFNFLFADEEDKFKGAGS